MRTYTIHTEDGTEVLDFVQFSKRPDLHKKIGLISLTPKGRVVVFAGLEIFSYSYAYLKQHRSVREAVAEIREITEENPVAFFIPHEPTGVEFLNDSDNTIKGVISGNGWGKSAALFIDILLDIIPCDPKWPIFTQGGVRFREYGGPLINGGVGLVSYEWGNHISTIHPQIVMRWTPKKYIAPYISGEKQIAWGKGQPKIDIAGTALHYLACSQAQAPFESAALDIYGWDEQGMEEKFIGANERVRRRNGRHAFALTGHCVKGRPDTGAGSWIHKIDSGENTYGHSARFLHGSIYEAPDFVYPEKQKRASYVQWVEEPSKKIPPDLKTLREGRSRLFGEWHKESGLVYDDFYPEIHLIDPIPVKKEWTLYRGIDHGRSTSHATACLMLGVDEDGNGFLFGEYFKTDRTVSENVAGIVEASGNALEPDKDAPVFQGRRRFRERWVKHRFSRTVLDSRSFAKKSDESRMTIGQLYGCSGLSVEPASGTKHDNAIPIVREWLKIDPERTHIQTGQLGAPRLYVFNTLSAFIKQIGGYMKDQVEGCRNVEDDIMDAWAYLMQIPPVWIEGAGIIEEEIEDEDEEDKPVEIIDRFGGY